MDKLTIAHISDLHFQSLMYTWATIDVADFSLRRFKESYDRELVHNLALWINRNCEKIDIIVVTGDIGHTGHIEDLQLGKEFLFGESGKRKWLTEKGIYTLGGCNKPIIILPGNHDRFVQHDLRNPGSRGFESVFAEEWKPTKNIDPILLEYSDGTKMVGVISVDFSLRSHEDDQAGELKIKIVEPNRFFYYLGRGRVYSDTLNELVDKTKDLKQKHDVPVIWLVHFPFDAKSSLRLIDEEKLRESMIENGVACLLTGHTHKPNSRSLDNGTDKVQLITAGSATSNLSVLDEKVDNSFKIIEIDFDGFEVPQIKNDINIKIKDNVFYPLQI